MNSTLRIAKRFYFKGRYFRPTIFQEVSTASGISVALVWFAPYLVVGYGTMFCHTKKGAAHVTCISADGIRVEYFRGGYDWIHCKEISKFGLRKQPDDQLPQPRKAKEDVR